MHEIVYQDRVSNRIIVRRQQPRVRDEVPDSGTNERLADKREGIRKILFHFCPHLSWDKKYIDLRRRTNLSYRRLSRSPTSISKTMRWNQRAPRRSGSLNWPRHAIGSSRSRMLSLLVQFGSVNPETSLIHVQPVQSSPALPWTGEWVVSSGANAPVGGCARIIHIRRAESLVSSWRSSAVTDVPPFFSSRWSWND